VVPTLRYSRIALLFPLLSPLNEEIIPIPSRDGVRDRLIPEVPCPVTGTGDGVGADVGVGVGSGVLTAITVGIGVAVGTGVSVGIEIGVGGGV